MTDQLEAERAVLGGVLFAPSTLDDLVDVLRPGDFSIKQHQSIFAAMLELGARSTLVDELTLADELKRAGALDAAGGVAYVAALSQAVPTAAAVGAYAGIVRQAALRRSLRAVLASGAEAAAREDLRPSEAIAGVEAALFELAERRASNPVRSLRSVMVETFRVLEQADCSRFGLATGFGSLDRIVGGLRPGELVILAARPSMGKTALALDVARNVATAGAQVLVFSIEMSAPQLVYRLLATEGGVDLADLMSRRVPPAVWPVLTDAAGRVAGLNISIDDSGTQTPAAIRGRCRRAARENGLDLVVVDYLQLMHADRRAESRNLELAEVSGALKALSKELAIPVLVLSQLNRGLESRPDKRPQLSDLRDSGAIEQDADVVLMLHRPEAFFADVNQCPVDQLGLAEVLIRKHRNGPTGIARLAFNRTRASFTEREGGR